MTRRRIPWYRTAATAPLQSPLPEKGQSRYSHAPAPRLGRTSIVRRLDTMRRIEPRASAPFAVRSPDPVVGRAMAGVCRIRRSRWQTPDQFSWRIELPFRRAVCLGLLRKAGNSADRSRSAGHRPVRSSARSQTARLARGCGPPGHAPGHRPLCRARLVGRRTLCVGLRPSDSRVAHARGNHRMHGAGRRPPRNGARVRTLAGPAALPAGAPIRPGPPPSFCAPQNGCRRGYSSGIYSARLSVRRTGR